MRKPLWIWVAVGVFVPLIFQGLWWVLLYFPKIDSAIGLELMYVMIALWPSSIMLLPAGSDANLYLAALLASVAINVVVYLVVGIAVRWIAKQRRSNRSDDLYREG